MNKLSCISLTNNLEVSQLGTVRPCCLYNGNFGNIKNYQNVLQYQTTVITNFDKTHTPCNRCWDHENLNLESKRQQLNKIWNKLNPVPNVLEIQLNNLCNLACTTCSPIHSSIWAAKLKTIPISNSFDKKNQINRIDEYINIIQQRNINTINLLGGEPSINPEVFLLLDKIIELDLHKKIQLWIVTNGYDIKPFFERYIKYFSFIISVSIDGIEDVFEYMRYGHSWTTMVSNLQYLGDLQKIYNLKINFTYTYSVCNIFHYSDFKKWFNKELPKILQAELHLNRVDGPAVLVPRLYNDSLRHFLDHDLNHMVTTVKNNYINQLLNELKFLDEARGISFLNYKFNQYDLQNIIQLSNKSL